MNPFNVLCNSSRLLVLLLVIATLIVILMPVGAGPATARYLFQSPVETPTPEQLTPTPVPPSPTPVPPTPTPPPEAPTATPLPTEPAPPTVAPEQPPTATPTGETIHLPAVEGGGQAEQPAVPPPEAEQPPVLPEAEQPSAPPQPPPPTVESEEVDLARLIDGLVVMFSYVWLVCGVLLLLAIPIGLVLFNRWGRRRRQSKQGRDEP